MYKENDDLGWLTKLCIALGPMWFFILVTAAAFALAVMATRVWIKVTTGLALP